MDIIWRATGAKWRVDCKCCKSMRKWNHNPTLARIYWWNRKKIAKEAMFGHREKSNKKDCRPTLKMLEQNVVRTLNLQPSWQTAKQTLLPIAERYFKNWCPEKLKSYRLFFNLPTSDGHESCALVYICDSLRAVNHSDVTWRICIRRSDVASPLRSCNLPQLLTLETARKTIKDGFQRWSPT